jgi:hypothetical protein
MFVSIDMDALVFLHAHNDHSVVSNLSLLEAPDRTIVIDNSDAPNFLNKLSRMEICMLYKNTTQMHLIHQERGIVKWQLKRMVEHMPVRDVDLAEIEAQVAAVEDDLHKGIRYSYARWAKTPAKPQELFPIKAKPLSEHQLAVAALDAHNNPDAPPAPPARPTRATPAPEPSAAATSSRGGPKASVRPIVRAAADKAWAAAGQPTDTATLKAMTKALIPGLEEQGYHPTTIRIKLNEWVKEHAA